MDTTDDSPEWRTHDGFDFDPPGHFDAAQSIMTSGNKQTADRSSSIQALGSCEHPERATYSFGPYTAFNTGHHPIPPIHQPFQQGHAPFPALANASIQPDIAMDMSIVQPYAGLNPVRDELEHYKEEIQTLYADTTLETVRRKVNSKYRLKASSKMYKDRIRKWGYNKNVKDAEKAAIVRKQIQRSYAGKGSEFEIRNTRNLPSKLSRYRKKTNLRTDQQALALRATTPPDLICRTPSPKPPLRMPPELESQELVARGIQEYVCGMLDSGIWRITRTNVQVKVDKGKEVRGTRGSLQEFKYCSRHAMRRLRDKDYTRAFNWLNIAMSMIEYILRSQAPIAWSTICSVLSDFWIENNCRPIAYAMLKHFAAFSTVILDRGHPFRVLFDNFLNTEGTTTGHNLALGTKVAADIFTTKLGRFNRSSIDCQIILAYQTNGMPDGNQSIDVYSRLAREMRDTLGFGSRRCWRTSLNLAQAFLLIKKYQKAADLAQTVMDYAAAANSTEGRHSALAILASAQNGLCQTILAETNMREAIRLSAETRGGEDAITLRLMSKFGEWLDDWGRAGDAASVRTDHENIFVTMFDKLHLEEQERFQRHGITDVSVY